MDMAKLKYAEITTLKFLQLIIHVQLVDVDLLEGRELVVMSSFYSEDKIGQVGFKKIGHNVKISKKASIYCRKKFR